MVKLDPTMSITTDLSLSFNYNIPGKKSDPAEGVFVCKTCHKEFASFQALGGHRTSHNRQKAKAVLGSDTRLLKQKTNHECAICGMEFPMGQALGGHMRRHRSAVETSSETVQQLQNDRFEPLDVDHHDQQHSNGLQLLQLFPQ